jgi:hypothetical protein
MKRQQMQAEQYPRPENRKNRGYQPAESTIQAEEIIKGDFIASSMALQGNQPLEGSSAEKDIFKAISTPP